MISLMYRGGVGLAISFFLLSVLLFFAFKVPATSRYLRRTSHKGLIKAAEVKQEERLSRKAGRKSGLGEKDGTELLEDRTMMLEEDEEYTVYLDESMDESAAEETFILSQLRRESGPLSSRITVEDETEILPDL